LLFVHFILNTGIPSVHDGCRGVTISYSDASPQTWTNLIQAFSDPNYVCWSHGWAERQMSNRLMGEECEQKESVCESSDVCPVLCFIWIWLACAV